MADREAVEAVVGLGPPAIEHGEIESAVQHDFLSTRAARFERAARIVQPDIDALHKVAADVDVVVLDEQDLPREPRIAHQPGNLLQHRLAGRVVRMRLAGEDELHGHLWMVDERGHRFEVPEDQVRAFVCRKPPREADGQRVRAEDTS